jgi:hypothetical protein
MLSFGEFTMKALSYAFGMLIPFAAAASAADYYIYQDYDGKIVITNRRPPSLVRVVLTYELPDSPAPDSGLTVPPPAAAETKQPDKATGAPAVVAPPDRG